MLVVLRIFAAIILLFVIVILGLWMFLPREPADLRTKFDPRKFGEGVQVYFESIESRFDDITPGVEKRVEWADGGYERRTPYSIVYIHGFSATSEEIRPVPDKIADALGANLVYTRLAGHGRSGAAMSDASVAAWMLDVAEALAAGRAVGEKVIVISTSTGGTLAAAAALDADLSEDIAGMIFVSPNFAVNDPMAFMLGWPGLRVWAPWLIGEERAFEPRTDSHAKYWTHRYPTEALAPMGALLKEVQALDFSGVDLPALFWFSENDTVVSPDATEDMMRRWGGDVSVERVSVGPSDDPNSHVVAGDILSPEQTERTVEGMLSWLAEQGVK